MAGGRKWPVMFTAFQEKRREEKKALFFQLLFSKTNKILKTTFCKYLGNISNKIKYKNKLGEGEWHSHRTGDSCLKYSLNVSRKCSVNASFLFQHPSSYRFECECLNLRSYIYNWSYIRGISKS
jgi:hypothetical protein